MRWPPSYLVFDFETTGLSPENDYIIQVGLCDVTSGAVGRRAGWLVNQPVSIPRAAFAVHGITTGDSRACGVARASAARRRRNSRGGIWLRALLAGRFARISVTGYTTDGVSGGSRRDVKHIATTF